MRKKKNINRNPTPRRRRSKVIFYVKISFKLFFLIKKQSLFEVLRTLRSPTAEMVSGYFISHDVFSLCLSVCACLYIVQYIFPFFSWHFAKLIVKFTVAGLIAILCSTCKGLMEVCCCPGNHFLPHYHYTILTSC